MNPLTCGILITFFYMNFSDLNISVQLSVIGTLQLFNIGFRNSAKNDIGTPLPQCNYPACLS